MQPLNDSSIRERLRNHILSLEKKPSGIIEEYHIHHGNAIADVVALYKTPHCFEIKGEGDKISRIARQSIFYEKTFRKITLVTTEKQIKPAVAITPPHWGILVAKNSKNHIKLYYFRKAKNNPNYDKYFSLISLWKSELFEIAEKNSIKIDLKSNKKSIASLLSQLLTCEDTNRLVSLSLSERIKKQNYQP